MSLYKKNKYWCPKRPSSDFAPSRRAKAAVKFLKAIPTPVNSDDEINSLPPTSPTRSDSALYHDFIPPPLEPQDYPPQLRYNPAEVSQQPPSSPTLSAVDSDRCSSHRRGISKDFNLQAPLSPTLTAASTKEGQLIDVSDLLDHAESTPGPVQTEFGSTFADLWNSTPPNASSTEFSPADGLCADHTPGNKLAESSTQQRLSKDSDNSSLSSHNSFYTSVSSPTAETKYTATASECVLPQSQVPLSFSDKEASAVLLSHRDGEGVFAGTSTKASSSYSRLTKCLDDGLTSTTLSTPSISSISPKPINEATQAPQLQIKNRVADSPDLTAKINASTTPTMSSEVKDQSKEPKKVLPGNLQSGNSSGSSASAIPIKSSAPPQAVAEALPPHLRWSNRFPDVSSKRNTSSVPPEESNSATEVVKTLYPPKIDDVLSPSHRRVPDGTFNSVPTSTPSPVSSISSGNVSSSATVSETLPSSQLRASNHVSGDRVLGTKILAITSKGTAPDTPAPHLRASNRFPGPPAQIISKDSPQPHPLAKFQKLLPQQKKLKPFPKGSREANYIWALYDSWESSSALRYANSLYVKLTQCITEKVISPGVTIRMGALCNVLVVDLPACNVNTFCPDFTTTHKGCKNKDKCDFVHDRRLRQLYLKQLRMERQPSIDGFSTELLNIAMRNVATKLKESTQRDANHPLSSTCSSKTYASTTAAGLPPAPVAKKQPRKSWDQDEFVDWARNNLNPATVDKLLIPYIFPGHVPRRLLHSPSAKGERTFHQFGSLPGEIRNQIWRFALLGGARNVKVRYTRHNAGNSIQPLSPPPPLLLVNHESRSLARDYWSPTFDNHKNSCPAAVYFHFKQDRLWIHNQTSHDLFPMVNLMKSQHAHYVRWISIPLKDYVAHPDDTMVALCRFKNVEQIWFVVGDSREDGSFVRQCSSAALNRKMKQIWARCWKDSRHHDKPPKCHLEIIPALQAHAMKIDGLCWL